mgnify:CR=1 FL=1
MVVRLGLENSKHTAIIGKHDFFLGVKEFKYKISYLQLLSFYHSIEASFDKQEKSGRDIRIALFFFFFFFEKILWYHEVIYKQWC